MRPVRIVAVLALLIAMASPASAIDHSRGAPGYCPGAAGVTVMVDFQKLGGDVLIRCAPGPQASGLSALRNAGLELTGVQRWGLGFICRIEGKPGADTEPCLDTPPATAYWSYWHAPNGGKWTASQYGVLNRKPPEGSFEGWSFSLNSAGANPAPRIAPVRPGQPVEPPPPPDVQSGAIPGRDGVPQAPPNEESTAGPERDGSPEAPRPGQDGPTSAPPPSVSPPSTSAPASGQVGGVAEGGVRWTGGQGAQGRAEDGFPWGALIGGAGALALGSAAGFVAWRRRRAAER